MITTIAICATVVSRRESQKARNAAILNGSGTRLTGGALIGSGRSGNRLLLWSVAKIEVLDQPRHGQALNEDREGHDHERRDDDCGSLGDGWGNRERQGERQRAAQAAPEQGVLIARRQPPARCLEQRRERINRQ